MKKKLLYITLFIVVSSCFIFLIFSFIENRKNEHLKAQKDLVKVTYNTVIEAFKVHSDILFFNKINTKNTLEILKNVNNSTKEEKTIIRDKIYNEFIDMYTNMKSFKIKQLHFHLKNNDSFLRFHRPNKFGDNLSNIRSTVSYVNQYHKKINGFEEGRIFNGYRFVYPLKFENNHIGSVETSVSMENIINELRNEISTEIDFIIKKSVVDKKVFKNEKNNYIICESTPNFYHEKSISQSGSPLIESLVENFINNNDINKKFKTNSTFNFFSKAGENHYITTFFPIKNAVSNEVVAYIIVANQENEFIEYQNQYFLFLTILIILTAIIIFALYRLDKDKEILSHKDEILEEVQKIGHLGYWELDLIKNELVCSDEIYHIYGLNESKFKFTYEDFLNYVHPDDVKKVNKHYNNSIKNKSSYHLEHRIITQSGELKYIEVDCYHTLNDKGEIIQSLGTVHDITEIKTYQVEIEKAKEQFETFVSHIPDVIYRCIYDENFTMLYINESIKTLSGYEVHELKLNRVISFNSIMHKEDTKKVRKDIQKAIKNNQKELTISYRIISKDNDIVWVKDSFEIVKEKNSIYLEGVISNITAQKEAYNKLHKFIDTQENIVILTNGKELNFANKKFFDFFGYVSLDSFKEKHQCICDFFIKDDRFFHLGKIDKKEEWVIKIANLNKLEKIVKILDKDLQEFIFNVTVNKFEEDLYIVSFSDISETIIEQIKLEDKNIHDKLTGAYNREFFDLNYKAIIKDALIHQKTLAVCILDIDHFKAVNDNYGHDIGDEVLI